MNKERINSMKCFISAVVILIVGIPMTYTADLKHSQGVLFLILGIVCILTGIIFIIAGIIHFVSSFGTTERISMGTWKCSKCGNVNPDTQDSCIKCGDKQISTTLAENYANYRVSSVLLFVVGVIIGIVICSYIPALNVKNLFHKNNDTTIQIPKSATPNDDKDINNMITDIKTPEEVGELREGIIEEDTFEYGTILHCYYSHSENYEWKVILPKSFVKQTDGSFYSDTYKYSIQYRKFDGIADDMMSRDKKNNLIIQKLELGIENWNDNYGFDLESGFYNTSNPNEYIYVCIDTDYPYLYDCDDDNSCIIKIIKYNPNDIPESIRNYFKEHLYYIDYSYKTNEDKILSDIDYFLNDKGSGYWEEQVRKQAKVKDIDYYAIYGHYSHQFYLVAIYYYGFNGYQDNIEYLLEWHYC